MGVSLLQDFNNPQALEIVLKAPVISHQDIKGILSRMAEGGMPQVVGQGDGLGELFVEAQFAGDPPGDLCHLQGVCKAGPVIVPLVVDKDLCLILQPPKGGAVDNAVPIPLKGRSIVLEFLRIPSPFGLGAMGGIRGEIGAFIVDHLTHLEGIL